MGQTQTGASAGRGRAIQGGSRAMTRAAAAGCLWFVLIFLAGFVLGVARTVLLAPALGELPAVAIELPVILALAWLACRRIVDRLDIPRRVLPRAVLGSTAFLLLMVGEAAISLLLAGRDLAGHLRLYGEPAALLGLAGQVAFALLPLLDLRTRARR